MTADVEFKKGEEWDSVGDWSSFISFLWRRSVDTSLPCRCNWLPYAHCVRWACMWGLCCSSLLRHRLISHFQHVTAPEPLQAKISTRNGWIGVLRPLPASASLQTHSAKSSLQPWGLSLSLPWMMENFNNTYEINLDLLLTQVFEVSGKHWGVLAWQSLFLCIQLPGWLTPVGVSHGCFHKHLC